MTIEIPLELRKAIKLRARESDLNSQQYVRRVLADAVAKSLIFVPMERFDGVQPAKSAPADADDVRESFLSPHSRKTDGGPA